MKKFFISIIFLFLMMYVGCIVPVPIPTPGKHAAESQRAQIDKEILQFLQEGQTIKEDVLLRIGEPDYFNADQTIFTYHWTMVAGYFFVFNLAPSGSIGGGFRWSNNYTLRLEFDENDIVKICQIEKQPVRKTYDLMQDPGLELKLGEWHTISCLDYSK